VLISYYGTVNIKFLSKKGRPEGVFGRIFVDKGD
jgi:hypothetical protein